MSRTPSRAGAGASPGTPVRWGPVWSRPIGWFLAHVVWSTRVVGAERVPRTGSVILSANHIGLADGPLVHGVAPRGTHILIKQEMFRGPIGWVLRAAGQIPVDRTNGRPALAAALTVLRRGDVVAIFPEGNRGRGDGASARAGVAWLAITSGAPVVPVAVLGTRRAGERVGRLPGFRRRLLVEMGEPVHIEVPAGTPRRDAVGLAHEQLRRALADHVATASARHGVPLPE